MGVLALQGDVGEHVAMLESLGCEATKVRTVAQLECVDALVLPGGESTTIARLLVTSKLKDVLGARIASGLPVLGTCAGLILLSSQVLDGRHDQWSYGALAVSLRRNGYGRQIASFEAPIKVAGLGTMTGVFIRAPKIVACESEVDVVATLDLGDSDGEHPVLVRQGPVWGAAFHPELTADTRLHQLFVSSI